eukprot:scaffold124979_cov41-Cyclotella_meneghiniana.AAC.2
MEIGRMRGPTLQVRFSREPTYRVPRAVENGSYDQRGQSGHGNNTVDAPYFGHQLQSDKGGHWPGISGATGHGSNTFDELYFGYQRQLEKGGHWPRIGEWEPECWSD